jgi:hypothetical protein
LQYEEVVSHENNSIGKSEEHILNLKLYSFSLCAHEQRGVDVRDKDLSIGNMRHLFTVEASMLAEMEDLESEAMTIERQRQELERRIFEHREQIGRALAGVGGGH